MSLEFIREVGKDLGPKMLSDAPLIATKVKKQPNYLKIEDYGDKL